MCEEMLHGGLAATESDFTTQCVDDIAAQFPQKMAKQFPNCQGMMCKFNELH